MFDVPKAYEFYCGYPGFTVDREHRFGDKLSAARTVVAVDGPTVRWPTERRTVTVGPVETTHVAPDPAAQEPEQANPSGWRAMGWPLVAAGVGVGAALLLHFRDPHSEGSYGYCPVYALTGWYCPGCGGMRGMHNLTDGRILDAVHSNLLVLPLVLAVLLWIGDWSIRAWRGQRMRLPRISRTSFWIFLALIIGYTVLRNTPWGTWLTPV